jgi:molybdate transport system regulatory protein
VPGAARPLKPLRVTIRLEYPDGSRIGHGKVALLEAIAAEGSIAAAARRLGMSYPRALLLIAQLEALLDTPVLERSAGGKRGGGAVVTARGHAIVADYRRVEQAALEAALNNAL